MASPPNKNYAALQSALKPALIATIRTTSSLCAEDIPFQRSLDPEFGRELDEQNARLLSLAARLLAMAAPDAAGQNAKAVSSNTVRAPRLRDGDELDANWRMVVDVVDSLLERTDGVLDEVKKALRKGAGGTTAATVEAEKPAAMTTPKNKKAFQQAANILKPQRAFDPSPNNFVTGPWKPLLTRKPHAKIPLEQSLQTEASTDGTARQIFRHPYQTEIEEYKYPSSMYEKHEPTMYTPYEETTATYVDTEESMAEMLEELMKAKEIAIDLEHHDQRTYAGIVCLMQISTREKDWVVDTLKPWRRKLECLNEVFTDPNIIKVLHGSAMDIVWLQRDLGLYIVGEFDTEHAATALHYPKRSLAFLLEKWVNFQAQKQYQLADWRVRPLSKELFDYARSDTHFLLYVYDCMRNQLIENSHQGEGGNLIERVERETKRYQLQRYENPFYDAENGLGTMGWYRSLFRTPALLSKQQFAVFKAVHQWRDNTARAEDESLFFVMSNHLLQSIAREMPTTKENLFAMTPAYANLVRNNADSLISIIADAKMRGLDGPEMREAMAKSDQLADDQHNIKIAARDEVSKKIKEKIAEAGKQEASMLSPPTRPVATVDVSSVKAVQSSFWGKTLAGVEQKRRMSTGAEEVRLVVPMPDVKGEIFTDGTDVFVKPGGFSQSADIMEIDTPAAAVQSPADTSDVFVLREKNGRHGKKRKVEDAFKTGTEEVSIHEASRYDPAIDVRQQAKRGLNEASKVKLQAREQKATRKAARKEEKEAQKTKEAATRELEGLGKEERASTSEEDVVTMDVETGTADIDLSKKEKRKKKAKDVDIEMARVKTTGVYGATPDRVERLAKSKSKVSQPAATSFQPKPQPSTKLNPAAGFMAALLGSTAPTTTTAANPIVLDDDEEAPFDYSNAPSVSAPVMSEKDKKKRDKQKKKKGRMDGFDPYKKGEDAPRGLPRGHREKIGMGGTFKK